MTGPMVSAQLVNQLMEERDQARAEALALRGFFKAHLDTMENINSHLGYPFSQPLINARVALATLEEKDNND